MESIYSIYILRDPRDQIVRYVGMSKHVQQQYRDHCRGGSSVPIAVWVQELRDQGLVPDLCIVEAEILGEPAAFGRKWHWAMVFISKGAALLNGISPSVRESWSSYTPTSEDTEVYQRCLSARQ